MSQQLLLGILIGLAMRDIWPRALRRQRRLPPAEDRGEGPPRRLR